MWDHKLWQNAALHTARLSQNWLISYHRFCAKSRPRARKHQGPHLRQSAAEPVSSSFVVQANGRTTNAAGALGKTSDTSSQVATSVVWTQVSQTGLLLRLRNTKIVLMQVES